MQAVPVASHPFASAEGAKAWFRGLSAGDSRTAVDIINGALSRLPQAAYSGAARRVPIYDAHPKTPLLVSWMPCLACHADVRFKHRGVGLHAPRLPGESTLETPE